MITIISSIIGFLTAGFPSLLQFFQDRSDKKHELAIMQIQLQMASLRFKEKLEAIQTQENIQEIKTIYNTYNTGIRWIDALNGSVRPIISYLLIITYCLMEWTIFCAYSSSDAPLSVFLDNIWTDEDQALFTAIISYYFGHRSFNKLNSHERV